jgi:glycosyltransferase involved in cell wall biosynthesis
MLSEQTQSPKEIVIYISGISEFTLPKKYVIANQTIPIHSILSSKRTMQSVARNVCSKISSGDIIIFFDVDDEPHPQKIEITHQLFNKYNPDFLLHNYISSYIRKQPIFTPIDDQNITIHNNLIIDTRNTNINCFDMPIHHAHIAVKREVFDKVSFNETMEFYRREDGKFCQDLITNKYKGIYCEKQLVRYIV